MSKLQQFRDKAVAFLIKHDVLFNGITLILSVIAIPVSLLVFPNATVATFVLVSMTGVTGAIAALSASLLTADDRKRSTQEEEEEDREREEDLKWRNKHDA